MSEKEKIEKEKKPVLVVPMDDETKQKFKIRAIQEGTTMGKLAERLIKDLVA